MKFYLKFIYFIYYIKQFILMNLQELNNFKCGMPWKHPVSLYNAQGTYYYNIYPYNMFKWL